MVLSITPAVLAVMNIMQWAIIDPDTFSRNVVMFSVNHKQSLLAVLRLATGQDSGAPTDVGGVAAGKPAESRGGVRMVATERVPNARSCWAPTPWSSSNQVRRLRRMHRNRRALHTFNRTRSRLGSRAVSFFLNACEIPSRAIRSVQCYCGARKVGYTTMHSTI